ncbi:hypothetical protein BXY70_2315 [Roseovarius halotolerans]|uniref:DUF4136 domain-containing protein n=1 Tax=Roseovarius halotolerans TaxID=505353 RepID=A0A1X6YSB1_9RHOB|nr:hypothetical protein [Roseovarius halotolerans]RKT32965.1 hypothetical protein BXY70_2315 [Roseovarius halotolerans]SLN29908.1 hypothetical protein ROH8110_01390 [Roseovarius halotolerans]
MLRILALLAALSGLMACTNSNDLDETPAYLGDFSLGHNVVVAPNLTKGPASREASKEEWIAAMTTAIDERFGRYEGERLYHLGISVEGYVLAVTGIPLVASPKSALILKVTVWDDAMQKKLNEEPHQVTVMESVSGSTILGSGLTQTKEKQLENLSRNAAKLIQAWMEQQNHEQGWFESGAAEGETDGAAGAGDAPAPDEAAAAAPAG